MLNKLLNKFDLQKTNSIKLKNYLRFLYLLLTHPVYKYQLYKVQIKRNDLILSKNMLREFIVSS